MSLDLEALEAPITRILTAPGTDLSTISAKRVRKALLENPQYAHLGLTPEVLKTRRGDVDEVIAKIFNQVSQAASSGGSKRKREDEDEPGEGDGDGEGEWAEEEQPPAEEEDAPPRSSKKKKGKQSVEESDAAFARKLSTEINSRSTRRGASLTAPGASSPRKAAKRKPKRSAETVESEDEDGEAKPKKRSVAKGGFAKEYTLR